MGASAVTTTGRVSLREYQLALSERLQSAEAGAGLPSKLGVQVGGEGWLVELADAAEVIPVPPISAVPLARGWFKGVANVRGNLYSVSDFSAFLGAEAVKLSADCARSASSRPRASPRRRPGYAASTAMRKDAYGKSST
ncbi:MAG: chemotaxis protein CheW [Betaproteobacteria bacterium]|nr:MAG: chemotaxis protein CheW [Betaproteobacteria bacterium]